MRLFYFGLFLGVLSFVQEAIALDKTYLRVSNGQIWKIILKPVFPKTDPYRSHEHRDISHQIRLFPDKKTNIQKTQSVSNMGENFDVEQGLRKKLPLSLKKTLIKPKKHHIIHLYSTNSQIKKLLSRLTTN